MHHKSAVFGSRMFFVDIRHLFFYSRFIPAFFVTLDRQGLFYNTVMLELVWLTWQGGYSLWNVPG